MIELERQDFYELVSGLFSARGKSINPAGLILWWDALRRLDWESAKDAVIQFSKKSDEIPTPAKIRLLARDQSTQDAQTLALRCHFHGDGRYQRLETGRPNEPSECPTMHWCDRCIYFVGQGKQAPDVAPSMAGQVRKTILSLVEDKS